jgi:hypothetical protein
VHGDQTGAAVDCFTVTESLISEPVQSMRLFSVLVLLASWLQNAVVKKVKVVLGLSVTSAWYVASLTATCHPASTPEACKWSWQLLEESLLNVLKEALRVPSRTVADVFAEPGSAQPFPDQERDVMRGVPSGAVSGTGDARMTAGARAARRSVEVVLKYMLIRDLMRRVLDMAWYRE